MANLVISGASRALGRNPKVMYLTSAAFTAALFLSGSFTESACWILTDDPGNYRLYKTINCFIFVLCICLRLPCSSKTAENSLFHNRWTLFVGMQGRLRPRKRLNRFNRNKSMRSLTIFSNFVIGLLGCFLDRLTERSLYLDNSLLSMGM